MKSFASFRLDTINHCLWQGEERVPLAPKAFDVLRYLVEHSDRLVTQEEILESLWPETYVNPEVVKKYILGIRKVLGDQSAKPIFIATYPRRGYQFIATVREETSSPQATRTNAAIVGRDETLTQLEGFLKKAVQGQRQVVFITGEAGIGKTSIVDAFQQCSAFGANVRMARGQCVEGFGGKEAYYPVLEAIGQLLRDAEDGPLVQAFSKQAPTWLVQFPSFAKAELRAALEKEIIGATRERMVREICEALETISAQNPLVLCLEDLHWVDASTLDFISALARRRQPAKLLLLGTYRPADVIISQSPLKSLKQDLVVHNLSHEISLERLEQREVGAYLKVKFSGAAFPDEFVGLISRHSGGNPLFMVTILQDMVESDIIGQVGGQWSLRVPVDEVAPRVPETLDQLIEAQFQHLSAVEQRILRSASVAGERFSVWALTTAAELDMSSIEEACEGLVERLQFIKSAGIHELANGQISSHYEFRHSLYREVLYRRLSQVTRSKLHLLLAQRLKAFCDPCEQEQASELALHFEGGYEYREAIRYLILAAENAVGRFAYRDCLEILRHAHELTQKLAPAVRAEVEVRILESMGDAHFALGALVESAQMYAATAARAQQAGLKTAQMHALTCAMYPLGFIGPQQGVAALEEAVQISKSCNDPARLALTQMLFCGFRLVFDTWTEEQADLSKRCYETLIELDASQLDPYQRVVYAHILMLKGNYAEALELCERAVSEASASAAGQVVNFLAHFGALSAEMIIFFRTGQLGKVLRIARNGRTSPDENLSLYWLLTLREAMLNAIAFDFEGARQICKMARNAGGGEFPDAQYYAIDQITAGNIALQQGRYSEAIEHFRQVQDFDERIKFFMHWEWRMTAQMELSNTWLACGDFANARTAADRFLESALSTSDPHLQALGWELQARVALAESNPQKAHKSIAQALALVDKFDIPLAAWQVNATACKLHRSAKDYKAAECHRQRAEMCILKIANSLDPDEPLRASFMNAAPIQLVLQGKHQKTSAGKPEFGSIAAP